MSEPFLGEIRLFGFNFPPAGWATCAGQLLPIAQNTALFSILGTSFGGNGTTNFALPNLQGNVPLHVGSGRGLTPRTLGEIGGVPQVTLSMGQMPVHSHAANCNSGAGTSYGPANNVWASDAGGAREYAAAPNVTMAANALAATGGSQPHNNLQPYLAVNFCIALQGIFPSRN
jgi:microcystin-dependent protein